MFVFRLANHDCCQYDDASSNDAHPGAVIAFKKLNGQNYARITLADSGVCGSGRGHQRRRGDCHPVGCRGDPQQNAIGMFGFGLAVPGREPLRKVRMPIFGIHAGVKTHSVRANFISSRIGPLRRSRL